MKSMKTPEKDVWRVFKIMSEFVEGFEVLSDLKPSVVFFGSARTKDGSKYYKLAHQTAEEIASRGFGITTGGGPGIMEAANRGAKDVGGSSAGVNVELPFESHSNKYIDRDKLVTLRYFFVRKVLLTRYAQAFVIFPGGLGTIDELFEVLTLIQTGKGKKFPVILMGVDYWKDLIGWLRNTALTNEYISESDFKLFKITDNPNEVAEIICSFHQGKEFEPNF